MSNNDPVLPINHTALSATGTTAMETVKGGIKGAINGYLVAAGTIVAGAAAISGGMALAAAPAITATVLTGVVSAALGAAGWATLAVVVGPFIPLVGPLVFGSLAGIGAGVGMLFGANKGVNKVHQEKGASEMLRAQVAAYQAQSQGVAQTNIYTAPAADGLPAQGSTYNAANSRIAAGSIQRDGMVMDQQLAAARA
jgi:hypothetical protein